MRSRAQFFFTMTDREMRAFERLSGDKNRLHTDAAYARKLGFKGRVVYGGLIIAAISRLLGMKIPGPGWIWHSLEIQFKSALLIGEKAKVTGRVTHTNSDLGVVQLAIEVRRSDRLIAKAAVQSGRLPSKGISSS